MNNFLQLLYLKKNQKFNIKQIINDKQKILKQLQLCKNDLENKFKSLGDKYKNNEIEIEKKKNKIKKLEKLISILIISLVTLPFLGIIIFSLISNVLTTYILVGGIFASFLGFFMSEIAEDKVLEKANKSLNIEKLEQSNIAINKKRLELSKKLKNISIEITNLNELIRQYNIELTKIQSDIDFISSYQKSMDSKNLGENSSSLGDKVFQKNKK